MRKFMYAVLVLLAAQTTFAGTVLLQENFESSTIGNQVDVGSPWQWTLGGINHPTGFACPDGSAHVPPVDGRWARIKATAMNATTSGAQSADICDILTPDAPNELLWGIKAGVTNADLQSHNSGAGITKGYVQWDWRSTLASGGHFLNFVLYDDYPVDASPITTTYFYNDVLANVQMLQTGGGPGRIRIEGVDKDLTVDSGTIFWAHGVDYRTRVDFDLATGLFTARIYQNAPAFDQVLYEVVDRLKAGDATFTGVKGLLISAPGQTNRNPRFEVDNIIFFSDASVGPEPEVAVTVDAADVADGGLVNFGAPAVGVPTSKTFTVSNTGTADLTTANLVLPAGYSLAASSDLAATIAASSSDDFIVELDTATAGVKAGAITFDTNDSDENPFNISVTADVGNTSVEEWTER